MLVYVELSVHWGKGPFWVQFQEDAPGVAACDSYFWTNLLYMYLNCLLGALTYQKQFLPSAFPSAVYGMDILFGLGYADVYSPVPTNFNSLFV